MVGIIHVRLSLCSLLLLHLQLLTLHPLYRLLQLSVFRQESAVGLVPFGALFAHHNQLINDLVDRLVVCLYARGLCLLLK